MHSHTARQKLAVAFADNPQTDALDLVGAIEFPNLALSMAVSAAAGQAWVRQAPLLGTA